MFPYGGAYAHVDSGHHHPVVCPAFCTSHGPAHENVFDVTYTHTHTHTHTHTDTHTQTHTHSYFLSPEIHTHTDGNVCLGIIILHVLAMFFSFFIQGPIFFS